MALRTYNSRNEANHCQCLLGTFRSGNAKRLGFYVSKLARMRGSGLQMQIILLLEIRSRSGLLLIMRDGHSAFVGNWNVWTH